MKYLRKKDDIALRLASMQANIFARSSKEGIPSYFFIQQFMLSSDAKLIDDLLFLESGSSELEIYLNIRNSTKRKKGKVYPEDISHWIGFFYRYASYLTGLSSKLLFKKVKPNSLFNLYPLYHSLDIEKAVMMVLETSHLDSQTPLDRFLNLYRTNKIVL